VKRETKLLHNKIAARAGAITWGIKKNGRWARGSEAGKTGRGYVVQRLHDACHGENAPQFSSSTKGGGSTFSSMPSSAINFCTPA
jgi:hypothetical protein